MKSIAPILAALLLTAKSLSGFAELGDGALYLETRFLAEYDSNITGSRIGDSDFILSVDPTLVWQRQGRGTLAASIGMNVSRFDEFGEFDSEDLHSDFTFDAPVAEGSPLSGGFNLSYAEDTSVNTFVGDRVSQEASEILLNGRYQTGRRLALRGSVDYRDRKSTNYSDTEEKGFEAGVEIVDIWQNVGLTIDYRVRDLESSGDIGAARDYTDDAISIGLTGQLLPESKFKKLEAFASVSFQTVDASGAGIGSEDRDVIGYNGSISWEANPATNVSLNFNRDVQTTITDDPIKATEISLGISRLLSRRATADFNIFKMEGGFLGRTRSDDSIGAELGLSYQVGNNWTAGARLRYDDHESTEILFDYYRVTFGLFSVYSF